MEATTDIKDSTCNILSGFIEENWEQFKEYVTEHGENLEEADEIVEELA